MQDLLNVLMFFAALAIVVAAKWLIPIAPGLTDMEIVRIFEYVGGLILFTAIILSHVEQLFDSFKGKESHKPSLWESMGFIAVLIVGSVAILSFTPLFLNWASIHITVN